MADCLSEQTVLSLFAGSCSNEESERIEAHVEGCRECRALVAEMARARAVEQPSNPTGEPTRQSSWFRGLAPLAAELARRNARRRVGTTIAGKWRLLEVLGAGGTAEVYGALHTNGRRVAIKVLRTDLAQHADICERFLLEGYVANRVGHPGAIEILDNDVTDDGAPFLVMERLEGESLRARIARGVLEPKEVVSIAVEVLDVLQRAHERGIVHRDIKPENIFLTPDRVKVLDFGIARVRDLSARKVETAAGTSMGTPAYMSPEQARGDVDRVDVRTDVFAVGATMVTALAGRPLHAAEGNELLFMAMTKPAPPVSKLVPGIEPALARILDRALAFERDDRWPDARSMREALLAPRSTTRGRRRVVVAGTVALALVAAAATLGRLAFPLHRAESGTDAGAFAAVSVPAFPTTAPAPSPSPPIALGDRQERQSIPRVPPPESPRPPPRVSPSARASIRADAAPPSPSPPEPPPVVSALPTASSSPIAPLRNRH